MRIGLVVEGDGDLRAFPALVGRVGAELGIGTYAPQPVRAGNHIRLSRPGQIERYVAMAASQQGTELVVVAVDVDDACAVEVATEFTARTLGISQKYGVPIQFCFCVREYEAWFLECLQTLRAETPEYEWIDLPDPLNPSAIRGAKERLQKHFHRHYKEITDQERLTRKIDISFLYRSSRSFRKFVKAMTGFEYDDLDAHFMPQR